MNADYGQFLITKERWCHSTRMYYYFVCDYTPSDIFSTWKKTYQSLKAHVTSQDRTLPHHHSSPEPSADAVCTLE